MNRNQIIKGPAVIIRGDHTYFFREDITLNVSLEAYDVNASHVGVAGRHSTSKRITISGTPSGMLTNAPAYFPWDVKDVGSEIFGATDTPLTIHTLAGTKLTFPCSANQGVGSLHLGTDATALGPVTFVCIGAMDSVDTDPASRYTVEQAAMDASGYDFSKVRTPGYRATFTPPDNGTPVVIEGLQGFDVNIEPSWEDNTVNAYGLLGITLTGVRAYATFQPANLNEAQIMALLRMQGPGAVLPGGDIAVSGAALTIAPISDAKGITAVLKNPGFSGAAMSFGFNAKRGGQLRADASLSWEQGNLTSLYSIAFPAW